MDILLKIIFMLLALLTGIFMAALCVSQVIIIICFGIPATLKLHKRKIMKSHAPTISYLFSLIIFSVVSAAATWGFWRIFPNYFLVYLAGIGFTVLLGLGKYGKTPANVQDFLATNAKYIDSEEKVLINL